MTFYKQSSEKKTIILDIFIFIKLIYFLGGTHPETQLN